MASCLFWAVPGIAALQAYSTGCFVPIGRLNSGQWVRGRRQPLRIFSIRVHPSEHDMLKILIDTGSLKVTATHMIMVIHGRREIPARASWL